MEYHAQSVGETLSELDTSEAGLAPSEVADRRIEYGSNQISVHREPLWRKLIEPFRSIFMGVLLVAALVSLWHHEPIDAIIIFAIIGFNAIIYYIQRFSTERVLRALEKHRQVMVRVVREEQELLLDAIELVPGDIILVEEGDKIPADARLIHVKSLRVNESQLTGESLPVDKQINPVAANANVYERSNSIYQGSFVVGGQARAVVTGTGNATEFGRIASLSSGTKSESPVRARIDKLISRIIMAIGIGGTIILLLALSKGIEFSEAIRFVIALAVSAVPEGLPVAISVVLVFAMRRMAARKALVRSMDAIESIGSVTAIATDKTGTLTKNILTVQDVWSLDGSKRALLHSLERATLPGYTSKVPDPLDTALLAYHGNEPKTKPVAYFTFEHAYAMSGSLWHNGDHYNLYVKGSPERMVDASDLTENERETIMHQLHHLTSQGFRVVALAHTELSKPIESLGDLPKHPRLEFDGLIAIADILRPEARSAIRTALNAGVQVYMITGDHVETAYHIGKNLGLVERHTQVLDCRMLSTMSDEELEEHIDVVRVFARVTPEHKHRLLTLLKTQHITAMTGDGVNDVPALTNAHVGVAMGSGTQIAKDAGDIILLDDNFRSIIRAVHEGRGVYANIKRMVAYLLTTTIANVSASVAALLVGLPLPFTAVQILWINLVTDSIMGIPLGLERGSKRIMRRKPVPPKAPLLSKYMISRVLVRAL